MANYQLLKADIDAKVYENAYREITGENLNAVLNAMVTTLGAEYQFAGVATIDTNPGTPDAKVFYIANGKGAYEKFGGINVTEDDVVVLYWDSSWHKVSTGIASQAKLSELESKVNIISEGDISYTNNNYSDNTQLDASGKEVSDNGYITTDFIDISAYSIIRVELDSSDINTRVYLYNAHKEYLDRYSLNGYESSGRNINVGGDNAFARVVFKKPISNSDLLYGYVNGNPQIIWKAKSEIKSINVFDMSKDIEGVHESIVSLGGSIDDVQEQVTDIKQTGQFAYTSINYKDNTRLNKSGEEEVDTNYITTDYIDISEIESLIRVDLDVADSTTKAVLYNSSKEYLEFYSLGGYAGTGRVINLLENSAFVRVTFKKPVSNSCSVSGYYAGNPQVIWSPKSETKMVNAFDLQTAFSYSRKMSSFVEKGEVAQGEYLITKSAHIYPNSCLSAHIQGAISNIKIGCGYNGKEFEHYAFYAEITGTEIKIYYVEGGTPLQETLEHGLTLDGKTDIAIITENENSYVRHSYIILTNSVGERYKHELLCWFGSGNAFVKNEGTTTINAELRLFPRSLTKNIWLFGDSYFSLWNNDRWPYYLFENKFTNALFNHLSGQTPAEGLEDLKNLLSLGYAPKMIIWCHGMNGAGDTIVDNNYVINPQKKEIIDWLIDFCKTNSIILVLSTIPTALVGSTILLHEGLNQYVRSCGERYIDFADAVGAQADGSWTDGLCADGVHPTEAGAKVLFARAIADCPELTE